ncbi:MAG: type II toxin-antitoxin system VapC family toxin [Planctomycetota bacterium]
MTRKSAGLLIDADVMVEYLRGEDRAKTFLESLDTRPATSAICVAELFAGSRNDKERMAIEHFLMAFDVLPVDGDIAQLAGEYRKTYVRSHSTGLADALVAATAATYRLTLVTFNTKHYPMLPDVQVPYPRD